MTDREKLLDILMDNLPDDNPWEGAVKTLLDRLLANGVVVREKGEWMERYNEGYEMWFYDCPFCEDGYATKQRDTSNPNFFCHNCGADMRKGENG